MDRNETSIKEMKIAIFLSLLLNLVHCTRTLLILNTSDAFSTLVASLKGASENNEKDRGHEITLVKSEEAASVVLSKYDERRFENVLVLEPSASMFEVD